MGHHRYRDIQSIVRKVMERKGWYIRFEQLVEALYILKNYYFI